MQLTVLEYVQNILSSMDSDEVNSITDTTEAMQIAHILRTSYFNIISRANLPEHMDVFSLVASGDDDLPVTMTRPDNVTRLDWVKYNKADDGDPDAMEYVTILPFQQFIDMIHRLNTDDTTTSTFTFENHTFYYRTDKQPDFCTVINDSYIIFDSLDTDWDTTLEGAKTLCYGQVIPTFELSDDHVPDLNDHQVPLLLNEAKALAFLELKQIANDMAVLESRRQWRNVQKTKDLVKVDNFKALPNFGRW